MSDHWLKPLVNAKSDEQRKLEILDVTYVSLAKEKKDFSLSENLSAEEGE
jgi:hypothetical protein